MHLNDFCHEPPRTLLILDLRRVRAGQGHLEVIRLAVKSCGCDGDQARGRLQGGSHHRHWLGTCLVEGVRYAEWCGLVRRCLGMPCPRSGFGRSGAAGGDGPAGGVWEAREGAEGGWKCPDGTGIAGKLARDGRGTIRRRLDAFQDKPTTPHMTTCRPHRPPVPGSKP